ncbi:MAG: ECF transporter S component [Ruminococcaceae bacterium]|nr:ECF transporter S component [Oscillospiraceae bacterium]
MKKSTRLIVLSSLFAALTFIATYISIPLPLGGYVNLGDCFVILSGIILGPIGIAAAAIGSSICDLVVGYAVYIPATAIIKALMTFVVYIFTKTKYTKSRHILSSIIAEAVMVAGYLFYEWVFIGLGSAAIMSVPYNCLQGVTGIITSFILYAVLEKTGIIKRMKL